MPLRWRSSPGTSCRALVTGSLPSRWLVWALFTAWLAVASAMTPARIAELRQETVAMFYHGFDNYMNIAFPEDELRPISCVPLTRDSRNPQHIELNDVLGNYSLTLIDSLSTLAILASAPTDRIGTGTKALRDFQNGVASLVQQYGDGTEGESGQGLRARGFDVDSKVQVFETVIRGVGGLLSAHLFAAGDLPIDGYRPRRGNPQTKLRKAEIPAILWPNGLKYNGQLLRLALDLAERLLPAFYTDTGMPYPRVNLRHGIPFYTNSPMYREQHGYEYPQEGGPEITETCSAGAGSLVLEMTVLSRLTGDPRFEQLGKRAFWAVWNRRSQIGLLGAGIDAENGQWIGSYAGIGAGTDSFFEYALKSHILLSGHDQPNFTVPLEGIDQFRLDPNTLFPSLTDEENSPDAFLTAWVEGHAAVKRHLYSGRFHPHYENVHLITGSPQAYWIDSLGAYYPGLLTLAGEVEEATETHLLYTALWTRYAALPERWSTRDKNIEGGLGWWPGRPEFIESTYHLYRATRDPWYLHVGEMVLEDIKRRCWTKCGWSGLQDVRTGEKSDRMESFFLGETAKYLYLLFDPDHPLNSLDAAYVFTTEGHPLLIPPEKKPYVVKRKSSGSKELQPQVRVRDTCPLPPPDIPFTISATAVRRDLFHASNMINLHLLRNPHQTVDDGLFGTVKYTYGSPHPETLANYTFYPWTLPQSLIPGDGTCAVIPTPQTFSIEFPPQPLSAPASGTPNFLVLNPQALVRLPEGILVKSLASLKLGMVYESPSPFIAMNGPLHESWRVETIANLPLGRDEQIFIPRDLIGDMTDPNFSRIRDSVMLDIVLQLENPIPSQNTTASGSLEEYYDVAIYADDDGWDDEPSLTFDEESISAAGGIGTMLSSLFQHVTSALRDPAATLLPSPEIPQTYPFITLPAIVPTGMGAAPIPDIPEAPNPNQGPRSESLLWRNIYMAGDACYGKLEDDAPRKHDIIVIRRGGCTFGEKLANIPSFTPGKGSLKMVIMVSSDNDQDHEFEEGEDPVFAKARGYHLIRPLLDKLQVTPSGLVRHHQICMVMVGGGSEVEELFSRTRSVGVRRRYHIESRGLVVGNIVII